MRQTLYVGTRSSKLALAQTNWVVERLKAIEPGISFELIPIKTRGDIITDRPLTEVGGKGLFVKEIEQAILRKEVDFAVHSLKDMPGELPEGLVLAAVSEREDPRDVLVTGGDFTIDDLPKGAVLGTSSLRRSAQLRNYRRDLKFKPIRGNLDTRIRKLGNKEIDGIVVAGAGIKRLGRVDVKFQWLPLTICLPAVGQGCLGIEARADDSEVLKLLRRINDLESELAITAERAMLAALGGGCQVPIAGFAEIRSGKLHLQGLVASPDGAALFKEEAWEAPEKAAALGQRVAKMLLDRGALRIIAGH